MKPTLILSSENAEGVELESIDRRHLEMLRTLKNQHRARFFYQDEISVEAQQAWYDGYCGRPDDWMFIVRFRGVDTGCIGYRVLGDEVDMYNLLRNDNGGKRDRTMVTGYEMLCSYITQTSPLPIRGQMLADNPAIEWMMRRGFRRVGEGLDGGRPYVAIEFDRASARFVVEKRRL